VDDGLEAVAAFVCAELVEQDAENGITFPHFDPDGRIPAFCNSLMCA
jgi:hypothetical protein